MTLGKAAQAIHTEAISPSLKEYLSGTALCPSHLLKYKDITVLYGSTEGMIALILQTIIFYSINSLIHI